MSELISVDFEPLRKSRPRQVEVDETVAEAAYSFAPSRMQRVEAAMAQATEELLRNLSDSTSTGGNNE